MITIITVIGIERIIPVTPQILPQKANAAIATREDRFKEFPINLGSIKFPTMT